MDSLDLIQIFREVARRSSFSATARALGVSPSSVSKSIARLEERFGLRLFHRTTRQVTLTDAGELLFERSGALLELVDLTQGELHERATRPSGLLTLSAPRTLMQTDLPLMLGDFLREHTQVNMHLLVTDRTVNLVEEGIDMALRVGPIPDANVIVKRLLPIDFVAAATPEYWRRHGKPQHPEELHSHAQIAYRPYDEAPRWQFNDGGKPLELALQPLFSVTDHAPLGAMAEQGLGVIWVARRAIASALAEGRLESALENFSPTDIWLHAAYTERRHSSAALRALLAHLDAFSVAFLRAEAQANGLPAPLA